MLEAGQDEGVAQWTLLADVTAPSQARSFTGPLLERYDPETQADVLLLVSEIVTNAVEHGSRSGDSIEFTVIAGPQFVRLSVTDQSDDRPVLRRPSADRPTGRGLMVVDLLADRWGVEAGASGGKTVWLEFPVRPIR